jgi:hypothetical protein
MKMKIKKLKKINKNTQTNLKTKKGEKQVKKTHSYLCISSSPMIL